MMRKTLTLICTALLSLLDAGAGELGNWPGFRGDNGTGIAPAEALPALAWDDSRNLKWKAGLPGSGSSSPVVWGEQVFITCYSGYGDGSDGESPDKLRRHLICLERETGNIRWDRTVPAELPEDPFRGYLTEHGYASNTPVTDGERIYVFFGKTGALAFDFEGKQLWKVHLGKQSSNRRWGSGASPMLHRNCVIINAAEESRSIYALDKITGREVWKAETGSLELCFGTPVLSDLEDGRSDLVLAVPGELWGMNPESGQLRWFAETGLSGNVSPTVVVNNGVAYVTGGYPRTGSIAVRTDGKGDVTKSHVLWSSRNASYVPTPIAYQGHLFLVTDQGVALCLKAETGELLYKEPLPGAGSGRGGKPVYASPVLANGRIYAVSRRNGTYVFSAQPQFELIARNQFDSDDSDFNATPAIVGRQLFLRSNRALFCIESLQPAGAGKTK